MSSGPILVTGATGFVGRHVLARAAERGQEAVAVQGDLLDPWTARRAVSEVTPCGVIHVAARPRKGIDPWEALVDELRMAGNLLTALDGMAATLLVPGSAGQYGLPAVEFLSEDAPTHPVSSYGALKCVLEQACLAGPLRGDVPVMWARSFNIVGPGQGLDAPIPAWARQIAELELRGGGTLRTGNLAPIRDFLDVRDVADVFLELISCGADGVVNVASGEGIALQQVIDELVSQATVQIEIAEDPDLTRHVDPPRVVADVARLRALTDWQPRFTLQQSLADVLDEWRARVPSEAR